MVENVIIGRYFSYYFFLMSMFQIERIHESRNLNQAARQFFETLSIIKQTMFYFS